MRPSDSSSVFVFMNGVLPESAISRNYAKGFRKAVQLNVVVAVDNTTATFLGQQQRL